MLFLMFSTSSTGPLVCQNLFRYIFKNSFINSNVSWKSSFYNEKYIYLWVSKYVICYIAYWHSSRSFPRSHDDLSSLRFLTSLTVSDMDSVLWSESHIQQKWLVSLLYLCHCCISISCRQVSLIVFIIHSLVRLMNAFPSSHKYSTFQCYDNYVWSF